LNDAIQEFSLAYAPGYMSNYIMFYKYGSVRITFEGSSDFLLFKLYIFVGIFNKTIIPLVLVGFEMIIANWALYDSLAIYHRIFQHTLME